MTAHLEEYLEGFNPVAGELLTEMINDLKGKLGENYVEVAAGIPNCPNVFTWIVSDGKKPHLEYCIFRQMNGKVILVKTHQSAEVGNDHL